MGWHRVSFRKDLNLPLVLYLQDPVVCWRRSFEQVYISCLSEMRIGPDRFLLVLLRYMVEIPVHRTQQMGLTVYNYERDRSQIASQESNIGLGTLIEASEGLLVLCSPTSHLDDLVVESQGAAHGPGIAILG